MGGETRPGPESRLSALAEAVEIIHRVSVFVVFSFSARSPRKERDEKGSKPSDKSARTLYKQDISSKSSPDELDYAWSILN